MRLHLTLLATVLLSGCGTIYYAPQTSSTAGLRITNASLVGEAGSGIYDNPYCIGGKAMGFNAVPKGQSADYVVDAGQPLTFVVDGDRGSVIRNLGSGAAQIDIRRCQTPGRFTPAPGGKYEIIFHDDGRACSVEVADISSGSRRPVGYEKLVWGRAPAANPKGNCAP